MIFQEFTDDWKMLREFQPSIEIDFHDEKDREVDYSVAMDRTRDKALKALQCAHQIGLSFVLLKHGWSTSRRGKTTKRSTIRKLMRDKTSTPYLSRRECRQHKSAFLAALKPNQNTKLPLLSCPSCPSYSEPRPQLRSGEFVCVTCDHTFDWFDLI
jgi:hypothetical protein